VERAVVIRTAELSLANRSLTLEIDQRRRAEDALRVARDKAESASKAKSAFLATMSHELRTPLNSVIGFSSVLSGDQRLPPDCADHASEILSNGRRLLGLVNDILDFTKMLSEEPGQHPNLVYLTDIIPAALEGAEQNAGFFGVSLTQSCAEQLPPIMGDSKRVSRALAHLLDNAIKFNSPGGRVVVAARQEKQSVVVEVIDTGVGIPATALGQIRDSFSQCDLRLDRRYEGTGLGLAYVARVSELHGAKFEIESEPTKGTRSRIVFATGEADQVLEVA
jgi:signal transduction histidine kinase